MNFCPPRIRSRPRHFPRLKTQITSSWENRLSWATSSRGAIPIERRAHFRDPPTRQTAEYSRLNGKPGFEAGNRLAFQPRKLKSTFSTEQKQTDLQRQKRPDFTLRKMPENRRLSVRRVLVFLQVGRLRCPAAAPPAAGHPSLRSGRPRQAHVFPPQNPWIARLSARLTRSPQTKRRRGSRADPLASPRAFLPLFAFRLR